MAVGGELQESKPENAGVMHVLQTALNIGWQRTWLPEAVLNGCVTGLRRRLDSGSHPVGTSSFGTTLLPSVG